MLGFYVAPKVVRSQAIEYVHETYGRQLAIGEVRIHPFKLQAEIKDLALPDADGATMIGFAGCSSISSCPRSGSAPSPSAT